jgi:antitoxin VapB
MALNLKNEEADRLARQLAGVTGETITEAIVVALRERLDREQQPRRRRSARVQHLVDDLSALPVLDDRSADAILGYDDRGLPA